MLVHFLTKGLITLIGSHKKTRKLLLLVIFVLASFLPTWLIGSPSIAHAAAAWPSDKGLAVKFSPANLQVTSQNPPDFRWPAVSGVVNYHLQVSADAGMTTVAFQNPGLSVNYYNFPDEFTSGTWYWRVKYQTQTGDWSEWSTIRKFRIETANVEFSVPPVTELLSLVGTAHPRVWTKQETLLSFQDLANTTGKVFYDAKVISVAGLSSTAPDAPTLGQTGLKDYTYKVVDQMLDAAFVYLIGQGTNAGTDAGAKAKTRLLDIASWSTADNGPTGYTTNDQVHRYIAYRSAIAYDWLQGYLSNEEKATVKNMIKARASTLMTKLAAIPSLPYDSHGWTSFGYLGIISVAMLHDLPEAETWFRFIVPAYINMMPPWGGEQGGWGQGTGYWQWSSMFGREFMDVLLSATGFDLYKKAYSRNEGLYPLYAWPKGSPGGIFGDGTQETPYGPTVSAYTRLAQMNSDPHLQWAAQTVGTGMYPDLNNYFYGDATVPVKPPIDLPDSKWFQDIGLVAMHSKLSDPDAVSLYFRSSPFGSYNHSHADQNSFVLNAFGEPLAIESGYYDDYGTLHDKNYSKQTFSSNAITIDGKYGQKINEMDAAGKVTGFVTHPDFDAVSGDATDAYNRNVNVMSKAGRSIIYVRPNQFVVIDQLQSAKSGGNEFAWRLHAEDDLQIDGNNGATILKGEAALKVQFHTPQTLRTEFEDRFLDWSGKEVLPTKVYGDGQQKHAAFIAPKAEQTTFVATMAAYKRDVGAPQNVVSETYPTYTKLSFADGTIVYVRIAQATGEVNVGSYLFDGTAIAVKGNSILLVDGKKVVKKSVNGGSDVTLIDSEQTATVVYGQNRLSVSSLSPESQVAIHTAGLAVTTLQDVNTGEVLPTGGTQTVNMANRGVHWIQTGSILNIRVEKGQRDFIINPVQPGTPANVTLDTLIDGVANQVVLETATDLSGATVAWGKLSNAAGLYKVEEIPSGLLFDQHGRLPSVYLEANAAVILQGTASRLKLKKIGPTTPTNTEQWSNPDLNKQNLYFSAQEAETYSTSGGKNLGKLTQTFLSGGAGIEKWDTAGQWVKWTIQVPRAGNYDLLLKYTAEWTGPTGAQAGRLATVGDQSYYFAAPKTSGDGSSSSHWQGLRVKTGQQLSAGPVDVMMWHASGKMNLDWVGLIEVKSDEDRPSKPSQLQAVSQSGGTVATVSWMPSTDNAPSGVSTYTLYVNGVKNQIVPNNPSTVPMTATISGLTPGATYTITANAVDTSGNVSLESDPLPFTTVDSIAPAWGSTSSLWMDHLFPTTASLKWNPASDDSSNVATYSIAVKGEAEADFHIAGTVTGQFTAYDLLNLTPGATYTVKVQAADAQGNVSVDGPIARIRIPDVTTTTGAYYDDFDHLGVGTTPSSPWTITTNNGASVTIQPTPDTGSGNVLKVTDISSSSSTTDAFLLRANTGLSGEVSFQTRFMYKKQSNDNGNFELKLGDNTKDVIRFVYFSDGTLGYFKDGSTNVRIPKVFTNMKLPLDQWVTLRFDINTNTDRYSISLQSDDFKGYIPSPDDTGTVDSVNGIYRVNDLPFYNNANASVIEKFVFFVQANTGNYLFDYVTLHPTSSDTTAPVWETTDTVRAVKLFSNAARLEWDQASDNSGYVSTYHIYQKEASQTNFVRIATVSGDVYRYDVTNLHPGNYTFQVRASDWKGNESLIGPQKDVILHSASASGAYYEAFDDRSIGNLTTGGNWDVYNASAETSVQIVPSPDASGNALWVKDYLSLSADDYTASPRITRTNAGLGGKVTFETRFMYKKKDNLFGNFELRLYGSGTEAVRFTYYSDGTFGYWNGTTSYKIPKASDYKLPNDQWITLRIEMDTALKTYTLVMQADAFKGYIPSSQDTGTVNPVTGEYTVSNVHFSTNTVIPSIDTFRFTTQRYKSEYLFDYIAMYP